MKNKIKFSNIITTPLIITPLIATCCATSEDIAAAYKQKVANLKETAIEEFKNICAIPHPSFHLGKIFDYLCGHIKDLGYEPKFDNYSKDEEKCVDKNYGNIYFDVPATLGCENWKKVVIQGHMDMVYAGSTPDKPIETIIEKIIDEKTGKEANVMHSKDYLTSLGADDGIGIATMFAIARNNDIKHGPIRFIITGDEEDGTLGANHLDAKWFDTDYLINVDGEIDGGLAIACYGVSSIDCSKDVSNDIISDSDLLPNCYTISANGFHGGHSGEQVGFGYCNAERAIYQVLNKIITNFGIRIQLVSIDHDGQIYKPNYIIPNANFTIFTDASHDNVKEAIRKTINDDLKPKYFGEDWDTRAKIAETENTNKPNKALSSDMSSKFVKYFGDEDEGTYCGLINRRLDIGPNVPGASCNIGPSTFDATIDADKIFYTSSSLGRSYLARDIDVFSSKEQPTDECNVKRSFINTWQNIFGERTSVTLTQSKWAWEDKKINPVRDILVDGYKKIAMFEPNLVSLYGMLEQSYFVEKKPELDMITIGPRIEDCHGTKETLYLDTIDNEYCALLYALQNFDKI